MKVSMNRIRSDMKKLNTDSFYVGTYETLAILLQDFPEWKGGKKPPVGGKICDSNSWAYVGKDSTYDTYKFNEKGKWKKLNNGGSGTSDHQLLSDLQGGKSPDEYYHLAKEVYDDLIAKQTDIMYIGDKDTPSSWQITRVGMGLEFSRYENGVYNQIYIIENSSSTDNYYINCPEGKLAYTTVDKKNHTLIKSSTDLTGVQVGNTEGRISLMNNGTLRSYNPIGEAKVSDVVNISDVDGKANATVLSTYTQELVISDNILIYGIEHYYVEECEADTTVRVFITDKLTGNILSQNCNQSMFVNNLASPVIKGANKILLSEPLAILKGKDVILNVAFTKPVKVQGMSKTIGTTTQYYIRWDGYVQNLLEQNMATQEWANEQPFSKNQSLQETLTTGNIMSADTNIRLLGVDNLETFDITKTNVTYTNNGHIDFDEKGYNFESIYLGTITPKEQSSLSIHLNPTANISPKLLVFCVDSVPNKSINLPDNIQFDITELDGSVTKASYKYTINTEVTPMVGIFSIHLDGRVIKNIAMTIRKNTMGSYPNFTGWGYMKVIKSYSGDFKNLFEKVDGKMVVNPSLIVGSAPQVVVWDDIKNKPLDILTDALLAETNRMALTMDSHGNGLMASTEDEGLPKVGLIRYDIPSNKTVMGNRYTDAVIQSNTRLISRVKGKSERLVSTTTTASTILTKPEFVIPFTPTVSCIVPSEIIVSFDRATTFTLIVNDIEVLSSFKVVKGQNNIAIPPIDIPCKVGQKIDIVIQAGDIDNPCFMGEIVGAGAEAVENLFYKFTYETYKDGQIMTSDLPNRKLLIEQGGKIQIPNEQGDTSDIVSFDRDTILMGAINGELALVSKNKPNMAYVKEQVSMMSTDSQTIMPAKTYSTTLTLKEQGTEFQIDSIKLTIAKSCMVRANVNGVEYGDFRQPMSAGEITLRPVAEFAMCTNEVVVELISSTAGVFYGDLTPEHITPKFTINLNKIVASSIASEDYTRNFDVDANDNVKFTRQGYMESLTYDRNNMRFNYPPRCMSPSLIGDIHDPSTLSPYFLGDYKMGKNEKLEITYTNIPTYRHKTRVQLYMDMYKMSGFKGAFVEGVQYPLKVRSVSGKKLNENYRINYCSDENVEYHAYFDYYENDSIIVEIGEGNDWSNVYMTLTVYTVKQDWEENDDIKGTPIQYFEDVLLDANGKIDMALLPPDLITQEYFENNATTVDFMRGKGSFKTIDKVLSDDFREPQPQGMSTINYSVKEGSSIGFPETVYYKDNYVSTLFKQCAVKQEEWVKLEFPGFGNVLLEDPTIVRMLFRVYKADSGASITVNPDTLTLLYGNKKLDYSKNMMVNEEYTDIEFYINGVSDSVTLEIGEGNDFTNLYAVTMFASRYYRIEESSLFKGKKIRPDFYDGWDSEIDLINNENISVIVPNQETWKHIDFNTMKIDVSNLGDDRPEIRTDSGGNYIYYYPNTEFREAGQIMQYTVPIPTDFIGKLFDIELCFDATRDGEPTILPIDFYVVGSEGNVPVVYKEYMTTIVKFNGISVSGDTLFIRVVAHPSNGQYTNVSECVTRFITFRTRMNAPIPVPMFVDNKINKGLLPSSGDANCVYLNDSMRVKADGFAFVFEAKLTPDGGWTELGRIN